MAPSEQAIQLLKQGIPINIIAQRTGLTMKHVEWIDQCALIDEAETIVSHIDTQQKE